MHRVMLLLTLIVLIGCNIKPMPIEITQIPSVDISSTLETLSI